MFFRNPEIKKQFVLYAVCSSVLTLGAFCFGKANGFYVLGVCVLLGALFFGYTAYRYQRIGRLSEDLDRVLHGGENLNLLIHQEGELAVLTNEIYKVTLHLREQAELLNREKVWLKDFIADISHQIKTPMTSVRLILLRLEDGETNGEERLELLRKMQRLIEQTDWLVSVLLKMASIESEVIAFRKERVFLKEVIGKSVEPLQIPMELKEICYTQETDGSIYFEGDFGWSVEAFGNLLKNCVEHSRPGGEIRVTARENPLYTEVVISDDGDEISKEDMPHIFERFYRGKNVKKESYGIGLALANMIIQKQGGSITVRNREDKEGVRFEIRFEKGAF